MAIYMKVPGVSGNVSAKGYEKWIELSSQRMQVDAMMRVQTGRKLDRFNHLPHFSLMQITKNKDKASSALFEGVCVGKVFPEVEIHECSTGSSVSPYAKYRLSNVVVSSMSNASSAAHQPVEVLELAYTKLESSYIPRDSGHRALAPLTSGYDIENTQMM